MTTDTTLNLTKGQEFNLEKVANKPLTKITVGLGWDMATEGKDIDLDASAILFTTGNTLVGTVYFNHLQEPGVKHMGDNLTGEGDGDDEQIAIDFSALKPNVAKILIVVTSYSGQKFSELKHAFVRVFNNDDNKELVNYNISDMTAHTGLYAALLTKSEQGWNFKAVGVQADGKTFNDLVPSASAYL